MNPRLILTITLIGYVASLALVAAWPAHALTAIPATVFFCWLLLLITEMTKMRLLIEQMKPIHQLGAQVYNQLQVAKQKPAEAQSDAPAEPLPGSGVESTV